LVLTIISFIYSFESFSTTMSKSRFEIKPSESFSLVNILIIRFHKIQSMFPVFLNSL
jgi:hypothetical protein